MILTPRKLPTKIADSIIELANSSKNKTNTIPFSLIAPRHDNLNNKVNEANSCLTNMCQQWKQVISHTNTIDLVKHLNERQLHSSKYVTIKFVKN